MHNKAIKKRRSNAGRKPSADPKQRVVVFIETSRINKRGGMKAMQKHLYNKA